MNRIEAFFHRLQGGMTPAVTNSPGCGPNVPRPGLFVPSPFIHDYCCQTEKARYPVFHDDFCHYAKSYRHRQLCRHHCNVLLINELDAS